MEPDAVHRLADRGREVLNEERRFWYLQAIGKLMHLNSTRPDIIFQCIIWLSSHQNLLPFTYRLYIECWDMLNIPSVLVYITEKSRSLRT